MRSGMDARACAARVDKWTARHSLPLGVLLAVLLSALLALHNVSAGPLRNLNDIGGWGNRALFIGMTAAVQAAVLMLAALIHRGGFARLALREVILTAGLYILLLPVNQKTYFYVEVVQPIVRAMDEGGLFAGLAMESGFSAPALTLLYLVTRGPVYDMYLVKLLCVGCMLGLALLAMHTAERAGLGIRAEAVLTLCLILPQGFMNAACTAQLDIVAVLLLGLSLALVPDNPKRWRGWASAVCLGAASAVSGAALYALPVYALLVRGGRMRARQLAAAVGTMLVLCLPAVWLGMAPGEAFSSLLRANLGLPPFASGAPNLMNLIPRAAVEEMPGYFMLSRLPELDTVTNAQPYYTQAHFEAVMHGLTLAGLAMYMGVCALVRRDGRMSPTARALALTLGALLVCPGATSGAWLAADVICVYALLAEPGLRLPACMVLFATAGASCYPLTREVLLPMILAFALCALALCMLLGVFPGRKGEKTHE